MPQQAFSTMCATTFEPGDHFDEPPMRAHLQRRIDAGLSVYRQRRQWRDARDMPQELCPLYSIGVDACLGRVQSPANLPEEHSAKQTIAQARISIEAGVAALHPCTLEGRHGYRPTEPELTGYFDDVLARSILSMEAGNRI